MKTANEEVINEDIVEDNYLKDILSDEEAEKLCELQKAFLESYISSRETMTVEEWLPQELQKHLSEKSAEEIQDMSTDIISSLKVTEEMKRSQTAAIEIGRSKDSWFASTLLQATSHMSVQESAKYLQSLDDAVSSANAAMHETITTKSSGYSLPNLNPNLDGFIAEQQHVNSFNMNAAAKGSGLKAEVQPLKPGETYSKNGFDVVIKDASGKRLHQYQMKYGATAEDTIRMIKSGNYNNQTIVVPADQVEAVQDAFPNKTVTSVIGEGNVTSNPLTKEEAKELQKKAQKGNFLDADWNDYSAKDIALGVGKQAGFACLQGAIFSAGFNVLTKVYKGEPIDGKDVLKTAIVTGTDFGVKTAVAGALKAASEKGILKILPDGTPGSTFSNIAFVAIENVKVLAKVATGKLTPKEGLDVMEQTTMSCLAGIVAKAKGAEIGAVIGSVFGPVGSGIGAVVGGIVGYMVGSKFAQDIVKGVQKVRDKAVEAIKTVGRKIKDKVKNLLIRIFG